ncbi:MAG: hypothetical protein IH987_05325 [Planctomycetes bacterium]|nr:hypothetical protein [Planctomycetota bacterium]
MNLSVKRKSLVTQTFINHYHAPIYIMNYKRKRVPPTTHAAWLEYAMKRRAEGAGSWQIAGELEVDFSRETVYRHIDPEAEKSHRESSRRSRRRERQRKDYHYNYNKQYRAAGKTKLYQRNYGRLMRNPGLFVRKAFGDAAESDLMSITADIRSFTENTQFKPETIERILLRFSAAQRAGTIRGPPFLYQTKYGTWRYDNSLMAKRDGASNGNSPKQGS